MNPSARSPLASSLAREAWSIILAGGKGTRLASVYPDLPKPMVPALGLPFIEWVVRYLAEQGVRQHLISLGHLAGIAEKYFEQRERSDGLSIVTVRETQPLGTGGGVRFAWDSIPAAGRDASVLVCNGDSLVLCDLGPAWGLMERTDVDGVIVGVRVPDAGRFGTLDVSPDGRLVRFLEKRPEMSGRPGVINAGVYLFKAGLRADFDEVADRAQRERGSISFSMEQDVFPSMLEAGRRLAVYSVEAPFLDIGTPESVREAEHFLSTHMASSRHLEPARAGTMP